MTTKDLFDAIDNHDIQKLEQLLLQGVSPNCFDVDRGFNTPLLNAIMKLDDDGPIEAVHLLINAGADVNSWNRDNTSHPLLWAIVDGHTEAIRLLFAADCSADIRDSEGRSPIRIAVEEKNIDLLKQILNAGVPITIHEWDPATGRTALGMAVNQLNEEMVELLISAGADPYMQDLDRRIAIENLPDNISEAEKEKWIVLLGRK